MDLAKQMRAAHRLEQQELKEERMYVRWLLFCKGRGKDKNLNERDSLFINHHVHRAHDKYLLCLQQGIDHRGYYEKLIGDPAHPLNFQTYRIRWYGGAKFHYVKTDVPKLMKMKWEQLHERDTEVRQQREGQWMHVLRREIAERDGGSLGVQVPHVRTDSGGVEGRNQGQKPVRKRRQAPAGSNRDAATVGEA